MAVLCAVVVTCPQCGTSNEALAGAVGVTCRACASPLSGEAMLARLTLNKGRRPSEAARSSGTQPVGLVASNEASLGDPSGRSGSGSVSDAFDLSSILDAVPAPTLPTGGAKANRPAFVPAFTFPGTEEPAGVASEPLDALGLLDDALPPPAGQPTRVMGAGAAGAWRVKNERGVEYELMTIDAVVAWLEGKSSYDSVRVARGAGAYQLVHDVPELAARLGIRPPAAPAGFAGMPGPGADAPLRLDADAMPPRRLAQARPPAPAHSSPSSRAAAGAGAFASAPAVATAAKVRLEETRADLERSWGLGFTLVVAAAACGVAAFAVVFVPSATSVPGAPASEVAAAHAATPAGPLLADAQAAYDARRYTAAEQLLMQAAQASPRDPQVQRLLALTLSKLGGRAHEARDALTRYRSLRAGSGED